MESWREEISFGFMSRTNITILLSESIKTVACLAASPASDFAAITAAVNVHILCECLPLSVCNHRRLVCAPNFPLARPAA